MGFLVAVANAFAVSASDVLVKKLKGENRLFIIWLRMASALPVLAIVVSIFSHWAWPPSIFWLIVFGINVPLEIAQFYLGYVALHMSDISLVAPLASLSSIFLIPIGYFVLGELPSKIGFVGVLLIVIGAFFLGQDAKRSNFFRALKNVFSQPGGYLVALSTFLSAISLTVAKYTFRFIPSILAGFYLVLALVVVLFVVVLFRTPEMPAVNRGKYFAGLSLTSGASLALHYTGLALLPAVYYISTKRLSMIFNVFFGKYVFHEENIRERLIGAILMVAGVIIIAIG